MNTDVSRRGAMRLAVLATMLGVTALPRASAGELFQEYTKLISDRTGVGALGPDLFGDKVSYYTGGLSFDQTDVSIPGNIALPVTVRRTYSVLARNGYPSPDTTSRKDLPFGDWDLDLPRISGTFASTLGWIGSGTAKDYRCSQPSLPPSISFTYNFFQPDEYFNGLQASLAGAGGGELLGIATDAPRPGTGGPYVWTTQDRTVYSCLPTVKNAQGEGFLARTADGTRYWFDWMASFAEASVRKPRNNKQFRSTLNPVGYDVVERRRYALYATRVEDRFGNWVAYSYTNGAGSPVRLTGINSSDGRAVTLAYNSAGQVARVTAAGKDWIYSYNGSSLTAVQQPDLRAWTIDFAALSAARINYEQGQAGDPLRNCMDPGGVVSGPVTGVLTHPSGARGQFTVEPVRFGRSNVLAMCKHVTMPDNDVNDDAAIYPIAWDSLALVRKSISGPGVAAQDWTYSYHSMISWFFGPGGNDYYPICTSGDCIAPQCTSDACAGTTVAEISGPGSFTRYTFGNSYRYNEAKLLKVETAASANAAPQRSQRTAYQWPTSGLPYVTQVGYSLNGRADASYTEAYVIPETNSVIQQDGVAFSRTVEQFDGLARPLRVRKSSAPSP